MLDYCLKQDTCSSSVLILLELRKTKAKSDQTLLCQFPTNFFQATHERRVQDSRATV